MSIVFVIMRCELSSEFDIHVTSHQHIPHNNLLGE